MMAANSTLWFALHELRISWRDLYAMLSANKPGRGKRITAIGGAILLALHFLAWAALKGIGIEKIPPDLPTLVMVSGFLLLPLSLMASQAMESITRAFYNRSDLELILASPAPSRKLFFVRMLAIALSTSGLTLVVSMPVINILALTDSPAWLVAYPVIFSLGMGATSAAILLTMGMFTVLGPKRTRLIAQIVAAVVGAGFVIGVQLLAIASIGSISRLAFLQSEAVLNAAPAAGHFIYLPALGAMGDLGAALAVCVGAILLFALTLAATAGQYGHIVLKAASIDKSTGNKRHGRASFDSAGAAAVLRRKEWKLLLRDKWLISQTLMQLLYLVPPAFMLWNNYGEDHSAMVVVVPVIIMASGQLAGGLAWLAISGEDAPELVTTAPVAAGKIVRAKVEAVFSSVAIVVAPLLLATALLAPKAALIGLVCISASVVCATVIQLWFRSQAKRSSFRRRQTSSRLATFSEAFSSILWAGVGGLWIAGSPAAAAVAGLVLCGLAFTWWISPARQTFTARKAYLQRLAS